MSKAQGKFDFSNAKLHFQHHPNFWTFVYIAEYFSKLLQMCSTEVIQDLDYMMSSFFYFEMNYPKCINTYTSSYPTNVKSERGCGCVIATL